MCMSVNNGNGKIEEGRGGHRRGKNEGRRGTEGNDIRIRTVIVGWGDK